MKGVYDMLRHFNLDATYGDSPLLVALENMIQQTVIKGCQSIDFVAESATNNCSSGRTEKIFNVHYSSRIYT